MCQSAAVLSMDYHEDYQNLIIRAREYTCYEPRESVETSAKKSKAVHSKTFLKFREHDDNKPWRQYGHSRSCRK